MTVLARRFGVNVETVARWKHRDFVEDRPYTAHRLQTTLTPAQEAIVVYQGKTLRLSRWTTPDRVRSRLCWRSRASSCAPKCRARVWIGACAGTVWAVFARPAAAKAPVKLFRDFVHVDVKYLPQMIDENKRRYLFVAIDRATRWVYVAIKPDKSARAAKAFLAALAFDQLYEALSIEHRLTRTRRPQTNGMGEVFERERSSLDERFNSLPKQTTNTRAGRFRFTLPRISPAPIYGPG